MTARSSAFLLVFTLCISSVQAQEFASEMWHEGKIVLLEGDTLRGRVKYDLKQDLLQLNYNNRVAEAYSARKVLFFEIFDNTIHQYRQFYALPFTTPTGYRSPIFFELLEEGKMTLLCREALEYRSYSYGFYGGSYSRLVLVYTYFFMKADGAIEEFTGTKKELLDRMGKHVDNVEDYIKTNRLKFEDKYDFMKIVAYYNSLTQT